MVTVWALVDETENEIVGVYLTRKNADAVMSANRADSPDHVYYIESTFLEEQGDVCT